MRPYSSDLRQKLLHAYDRDEPSQRQLAARLDLAPSTLQNWIRRRGETGSAAALKPGAPSPKLDEAGRETLRTIVEAHPDATLGEGAQMLFDRTGVRLHPPLPSGAASATPARRAKKDAASRRRAP